MTFRLAAGSEEPHVPVLVMRGSQQTHPIIGFNVIEHVIVNSQKNQTNNAEEEKLRKTVHTAFPNLKKKTVKAFISAVNVERTSEYLVRTACQRVSVPSHSAIQVKCRINVKPLKEDTTLSFEPADNPQWPEGLEFCNTLVQVSKGAQPASPLVFKTPLTMASC